MDSTYIRRVCHEVAELTAAAGWNFHSHAVVEWEFANRAEFHDAIAQIKMSLDKEPLATSVNSQLGRANSNVWDVWEFDCVGVTFRLRLVIGLLAG